MTMEEQIESAVERTIQRILGPHLHRIAAPEPVVYTVAQVAGMLQVSEDTVGRMVKRGRLPKLPDMGTKVLIPRRAVDDLVSVSIEKVVTTKDAGRKTAA